MGTGSSVPVQVLEEASKSNLFCAAQQLLSNAEATVISSNNKSADFSIGLVLEMVNQRDIDPAHRLFGRGSACDEDDVIRKLPVFFDARPHGVSRNRIPKLSA